MRRIWFGLSDILPEYKAHGPAMGSAMVSTQPSDSLVKPTRRPRRARLSLAGRILSGILCLAAGCTDATDQSAQTETWESYYMGGTKIGYSHVQSASVADGDGVLARTTAHVQMKIQRFGQTTDQHMELTCWESPSGQLVRFESRLQMGPAPMTTHGERVGDQLEMRTNGQTSRVTWRSGWGGFFAVEQSLEREPLQPGQRRNLRQLVPVFNSVADVLLEAVDYERTPLLTGMANLLKIRNVTRLDDGNSIESWLWTDQHGRTQKTLVAGGQESYRTTRQEALDESGYTGLDLGRHLIVKVNEPLSSPHTTRQVRYRVRLPERDPADLVVAGASQQVHRRSPHEAELIVRAVGPSDPASPSNVAEEGPGPWDLAPNPLIQSDDARIVALAQGVEPELTDPWPVAQALERAVHGTIHAKDFSQVFASAAEVIQSRTGDCTEHAVLLAALCRVRNIPARVAIGLVYYPAEQGFAYHMWNEVWIRDRWIPLDATLGLGGIGAAHIKLSHSHLHGAGAYSTFLPILHVMGQLELEILEVQ